MDVLTESNGSYEIEKASGIRSALRGLTGLMVMSPWYVLKFCIVCFYTLPVSFFFVFSTIMINPSILSEHRMDIFQLVFDHYDKLFQYSITITVVMAFIVMMINPAGQILGLLKQYLLNRMS